MKNDLITDVEKGDPITADGYNEVLETIRQFQGLTGSMVVGGKLITRPLDHGSDGTALLWAMVTGDIPAFTAIDGTAKTATPGKSTAKSVSLMQWNAASLEEDDDQTTLYGVNGSGTDIRASVAEPILVLGFEEDVDGDDCFTITNVMDFRGLPEYDKTKMQIPFHLATDGKYRQAAEDCQ